MKKNIFNAFIFLFSIFILPICTNAADYTLPSGLLEIQEEAFLGNTMETLVLPEGLQKIGPRAFSRSTLTKVTIPESVESIAANAFEGCSSNLKATVTFGSYAHRWCNVNGIPFCFAGYSDPLSGLTIGLTNATVHKGGETLLYAYTAAASGSYRLTFLGSQNARLSLYDANGAQTVTSDHAAGDHNLFLDCNLSKGALYYFEAAFKDSSETGSFPLLFTAGPVYEMGPNDQTGNVAIPGRSLWYRFTPPTTDTYSLTYTGSQNVAGSLYNSTCERLATASGNHSNPLKLQASLSAGQVYCYELKFTDSSMVGDISFVLKSDSAPVISAQPRTTTVIAGSAASFTVTATGTGLRYQWQQKLSGATTWTNSTLNGSGTNTLSFSAPLDHNEMQVRCAVQDEYGFITLSDTATLYVSAPTNSKYRALLIAEVNHEGDTAIRNRISVEMVNNALQTVKGPGGGKYTVYGGNHEYEDSSPTEILSAISTCFGDATEDDVSLLFIASHGRTDTDGILAGSIATVRSSEGHFCPIPDRPGYAYVVPNSLYIDELATALKKIKGEVIIVIHTCGSGAGIYSADVSENSQEEDFDPDQFNDMVIKAFKDAEEEVFAQTGELRVGNKFYVMTSSAHREETLSWVKYGGIFTNGLVEGIGASGIFPADTSPADGKLTLDELYKYSYDYVIKNTDGKQHPQVYPQDSNYLLFLR